VGILDLESAKTHAFTAEDERMLQTLGSYIAVALENARLFGRSAKTSAACSTISIPPRNPASLLPVGAREIPGSISAQAMPRARAAVDFYDFLPSGEAACACPRRCLRQRHGCGALRSLAVGVLREHGVGHSCPPAEVLASLNQRLHSRRLEGRFIAMAFASTTRTSHPHHCQCRRAPAAGDRDGSWKSFAS